MENSKIVYFNYKFKLPNGSEKTFTVELNPKTLDLVRKVKEPYPQWTELEYNKCANCSLDKDKNKFCPTAVNMMDLIEFSKNLISYKEADVHIETEERLYMAHTTMQRGLSSIIGIYMVTSGCPAMERLKPMVRYHLPFATLDETRYRVMSMYLLAQYFLYRHGKEPDWDFKNLVQLYDDIRIVNQGFFNRLTGISVMDASVNALVILDCFADFVTSSIYGNILDDIEPMFSAYLK